MGTDRDPVPTCKVFVRNLVVLFLALYRVFNSMESLSFDSPAENNNILAEALFLKLFEIVKLRRGFRFRFTKQRILKEVFHHF